MREIKILCGPDGADYIEYPDVRRQAAIWEVVKIGNFNNPEAVSALIDLVLYGGFDEYDGQLSDKSYHYRVSHAAVCALLDQPLTESPVIRVSDLPNLSGFTHPDLKLREQTYRHFYGSNHQYALKDCRAWCQEVRDGKRTFQMKGSKLRYNALGKPVNAPPPRTHRRNLNETLPEESEKPTSETNPAMKWLITLLVLIIAGGSRETGHPKDLSFANWQASRVFQWSSPVRCAHIPQPLHHPMPRVSITIPGKNSQPYRFKLDREKVSIGRSSDNDIVVDCPSVSGTHCTMERVPGGYILRDRNSTNGIRLDDKFMSVIDLQNNADVRVGDVKFGYTLSKEELDELDLEEFVPHQESSDDYVERRSHMVEDRSAKKKANFVTGQARPSVAVAPALASASQGPGFFYGVCLLLAGILAFYAGLNSSYQEKQSKTGREGEVSLYQDIKDGRPPLPKTEEDSEAK